LYGGRRSSAGGSYALSLGADRNLHCSPLHWQTNSCASPGSPAVTKPKLGTE
jgi:hypothetical protein